MSETVATPGSDLAVAQGCTCPVLDNQFGRGSDMYGPGTFWMNADCPLHGTVVAQARAKQEADNG